MTGAECVVAGGILLVAFLFTHFFTQWAYKRCAACGGLNAHRRQQCRLCSHPFEPPTA